MCIIVDANCAHDLALPSEDGKPVLRWLLNPKAVSGLVIGGKLASELHRGGLRLLLVELSRAGRLRRIPADRLEQREGELEAAATCQSNDVHVVALALESRCTLVFTRDKPLHGDLKRHSEPGNKISIYQHARHRRLLTECQCP